MSHNITKMQSIVDKIIYILGFIAIIVVWMTA
jgi:hypothetical protein